MAKLSLFNLSETLRNLIPWKNQANTWDESKLLNVNLNADQVDGCDVETILTPTADDKIPTSKAVSDYIIPNILVPKGHHAVSLTNYDNTNESQIAAGSEIEIEGTVYKITSNLAISDSPADGTVYIRLVPNGDTITAEYTNTAPTWSDSKQGWYGTGGDANKRYLEFIIVKTSSEWLKRSFPRKRDEEIIKNRSYLRAYRDSIQSFTGTTGFTVLFDKELFDSNSEYDTATGIFTAKRSGLYSISYRFTLNITSLGASTFVQSSIRVGGNNIYRGHVSYATGLHVFSGRTVYNVSRGETISIRVNQSSAATSSLDDTTTVSCLFEVLEL